jgi:hypothetical protein
VLVAELFASDSILEHSFSTEECDRSLVYVMTYKQKGERVSRCLRQSEAMALRTTFAPREARSKAMASPIPRDAPVTMALYSTCQHAQAVVRLQRGHNSHFTFKRARLLSRHSVSVNNFLVNVATPAHRI